MTTLAPWTEQWQHFTSEVREQFWGRPRPAYPAELARLVRSAFH